MNSDHYQRAVIGVMKNEAVVVDHEGVPVDTQLKTTIYSYHIYCEDCDTFSKLLCKLECVS